ncbi:MULTISPECIES: hypothetical protein [unclassified Synechococcus]|uniref:hypothetical protein n=1 Tax=unclassified Synechococcus TaxID=2626047 RepID=UPI001C23B076|nr:MULTISPECIES: hypothetical protein [unclassified Synechococcus]
MTTATATTPDQRIRELQTVLLDPATDRPTWMAAHREIGRIQREAHLRRQIEVDTNWLERITKDRHRHPDVPQLRRRLAANLAELRQLEGAR